jgi:transcriptional regulator with XRE-family HTH domain
MADLTAVGTWLKAAREKRGETLEEISGVTRIGRGYLEAIESGEAAKLPSQAYTRGFIRLYAMHLGLSPDEALTILEGVAPATGSNSAAQAEEPHPLEQTEGRPVLTSNRLLLSAAALLIAVLAGGYLLKISDRNTALPLQTVSSTAPVKTASSSSPLNNAAETAPKKELAPPAAVMDRPGEALPAEGLVLRLKAVSDGRLHINIDGSVSQGYDLAAGDLVEWKADRSFQLDLDNAGSVVGDLNGTPLKPFGEPGKAAHLVIRPDGVHPE